MKRRADKGAARFRRELASGRDFPRERFSMVLVQRLATTTRPTNYPFLGTDERFLMDYGQIKKFNRRARYAEWADEYLRRAIEAGSMRRATFLERTIASHELS